MLDPSEELGTPEIYRSPELLLDKTAGFGSDLWALGCTLFEIRTGGQLFNTMDVDADDALYNIVLLLGKLPEPWWTTWEGRKACFKDEGSANGRAIKIDEHPHLAESHEKARRVNVHPSVAIEPWSIKETLASGLWYLGSQPGKDIHCDISENEIDMFASLLQSLPRYQPDDRCPADIVQQHEWFKVAPESNTKL